MSDSAAQESCCLSPDKFLRRSKGYYRTSIARLKEADMEVRKMVDRAHSVEGLIPLSNKQRLALIIAYFIENEFGSLIYESPVPMQVAEWHASRLCSLLDAQVPEIGLEGMLSGLCVTRLCEVEYLRNLFQSSS